MLEKIEKLLDECSSVNFHKDQYERYTIEAEDVEGYGDTLEEALIDLNKKLQEKFPHF